MSAPARLDPHTWDIQRWSLFVGTFCLTACLLGALRDPTQFFRSYLLAYVFWIGLPLGSLSIVMLHHLTGGSWGLVIRRLLESGSRTLIVMALLFVPVLCGLHYLYQWAQPMAVAADPLLQYKRPYLNTSFFVARAILYFAVWIVLAHLLNKWSLQQDNTAEFGFAHRLTMLSGPGLVLYSLTTTFASIDWVMSIEAHWFSTIYGMQFIIVQALMAMAAAVLALCLLSETPPLSEIVSPEILNDLGNLLLTFVMMWAYLAFSQFLIIWSGNLQDEIPWYTSRARGGWAVLAVILIVFHFGVPFLLLLSREVKRNPRALAAVALGLIVLSLLDVYWLVVPGFEPGAPRIHWMDFAAIIGIGGIWLAAFLAQMKARPLMPLHALALERAPEHGN